MCRLGATLLEQAQAIRLKREGTSSEEEPLPRAPEMAVRSLLMAITEDGVAWCSNSSNNSRASSRPRFPERKRSAMARSSSKQRSRTRRDMPTGHGTASSPARRRYYLTCCPWTKSFSNLQSTTSNLPKQNKW